ncbi:MAG TPA: DNA replication/repair protein RecF [Clostridia bacterium]|nr:DNA replication/repair protein RecF [Clostridia bacterium]
MLIKKIKLKNFRNYKELNLDLKKGINVLYGDNAQGKTNIIESIYIAAIGKSFRTNKDNELIKFGENFSEIDIDLSKIDRDCNIKVELQEKKDIYLNGIKLKKLSEILGNLNIVIFTPEHINILKNGPSYRRRFIDIMIGQLRPNYIYLLNNYNKILEQRNNYLKQIKFEKKEEKIIEIWDENLVEYGHKIFLYRNEFFEKLKNKINKIHCDITENKEDIKLVYFSDCNNKENFSKILVQNRKNDILKGFTNKGIHRDDFMIYINNVLVNIYGSQGQHRTSILSLKKAELEVVKEEIGEYPVLLLDDFMSELDEKRTKRFLENINDIQVIITSTNKINNEKININSNNIIKGSINN